MIAVLELRPPLGAHLIRSWQLLHTSQRTCNFCTTRVSDLCGLGLRGSLTPYCSLPKGEAGVRTSTKERWVALLAENQNSIAQLDLQTVLGPNEATLQLLPCLATAESECAPDAGTGGLKQARKRKRALRQCLLQAGLESGRVEKLLASARNVGDHAEERVELCHGEGGGAGTGVLGHPWLLTCNYQDLLAVRSVLLDWGVSLKANTKILRHGLEHGPANVDRLLHLMAHLGVPDLTRLLHAYPGLLVQRNDKVVAKLAYLGGLGLSNQRLCHFFCTKPQFISPSLDAMQSRVAFFLGAGFTEQQTVRIISRHPLALACDVSSHFSHVRNLFKEFGFSPSDFVYVVERYPAVLVCKVDSNLRPKLRYFRCMGLTPRQLVAMVRAYPLLLAKNLDTALKLKVDFLLGPMERDVSELVTYACVLGYSMARLQRRQATVSQYGISCSLSTMLSRPDAQFEAYVQRISRQTYQAKMAGVREIYERQRKQKPAVLDMVQVADFELPVYKMHSGGQLKWPVRESACRRELGTK